MEPPPSARRLHDRAYQAHRRTLGLPDPDDPRHGSVNGYRAAGCRCDRCREANRLRQQRVRAARKGC